MIQEQSVKLFLKDYFVHMGVRQVQKGNKELLNGISTAATIGFYMMSAVVVGILLGRMVDGYLGSGPWATVIGIVLGMITGMWAIYKKVVGGK